jgi:hypothetical protein
MCSNSSCERGRSTGVGARNTAALKRFLPARRDLILPKESMQAAGGSVERPPATPFEQLARDPAPILAIDLGKFKSTACVYHAEGGAFAVSSFVTERDALLRLLSQHRPRVVVEACLPAGWMAERSG